MKILQWMFALLIVFTGRCFATHPVQYDDFERYNDFINPGIAVMVLKENETVFAGGYGYENVYSKNKITVDTPFDLASITKQFVAMTAAILNEKGLLDLNAKITQFYPDFPAYGKDVTLNHLIHHTGGLPDYMQNLCYDNKNPVINNKNVLDFLYQQKDNLFTPGDRFEYSNTGYVVLVSVLEKVSGVDFATLVNREILQPLNMQDTKVGYANIKDEPRANGYGIWPFFEAQDHYHCSYVTGDSEIYSSVRDLGKWALAIQNHQLVSSATMDKIFSGVPFNNGQMGDYGYGWFLKDSPHGPIYSHNGSRLGFRSWIVYLHDQKMWFIILTNTPMGIYAIDKLIAPYAPDVDMDFLSS